MYLLSHVFVVLFGIVTGLYFAYIIVHLLSWRRMPVLNQADEIPITKISVIIAARNEEGNIGKCLDALSKQDYPVELFEVIVVDDHSDDKTKTVTEKLLPGLKINGRCISNNTSTNGKKGAITEGIKNSNGELIVITDADCISGKVWLKTIESSYRKSGTYMLCGPVAMSGEKGIIGKFQSLELCGLSLLAGAGINLGYPLLCNGANIAYTRKVFDDVNGFEGIDSYPSGDDILLMFKIHKKYPAKVTYIKSQKALITTLAQPTWKEFISQRIRWASKGLYVKNTANSLVSLLVLAANFLGIISIILLAIIYPYHSATSYQLLALSFVLKLATDFLLLFFASGFFKKTKLLWVFPTAEIVTMFYISWVGITANFSSYAWKGRNYKSARLNK